MALIGTIAIYDNNTTQISIPGWITTRELELIYLANRGALSLMGQDSDSPEVVKIAARIMARAGARKRAQAA